MRERYLRALDIRSESGEAPLLSAQVRDPEHLHEIFTSIKDGRQETLIGVFVTDTLAPLTYSVLSLDKPHVSLIDPRDVFRHAILTGSTGFALLYKRLKDDPTPLPDDQHAMQVIAEQARVMDLRFLDFLVVGEGSYWSMFEANENGEYARQEG